MFNTTSIHKELIDSYTGYVKSGAYSKIPPELYHLLPGVSNSQLKLFAESPDLYEHNVIKGQLEIKQTASQELGTAVHALVLEPNEKRLYVCSESGRTKLGKKQREHAREQNLLPLSADQYDVARYMRDAIYRDPVAAEALKQGFPEVSLFNYHEPSGLYLRGRLDHFDPERALIADLKSTKSLSPTNHQLFRDIYTYRWHVQEAFYRFLAVSSAFPVDHFLWIVVTNEKPYRAVTRPLNERSYQEGQSIFESDLAYLAECHKSDNWPIYDWNNRNYLNLPEYGYKFNTE